MGNGLYGTLKILLFSILLISISACASLSSKNFPDKESGFSSSVVPFLVGNGFYSYTHEAGENNCDDSQAYQIKYTQEDNWSLNILAVSCSNFPLENHILQNKAINILSGYFAKAKSIVSNVIMEELPKYSLTLYIMPNNVRIDEGDFSISLSGIKHRFYVQMPIMGEHIEQRLEFWAAEAISSVLHEYFHAANIILGYEYPNTVSEEASAYVFGRYLSSQFLPAGKTKYEFIKNGKNLDFDPQKPVLPISKEKIGENSIMDSVAGRSFALRSILHVIGSTTLDMGDAVQRIKLLELCKFLINKKPDITKPQDLSWIANMTAVPLPEHKESVTEPR